MLIYSLLDTLHCKVSSREEYRSFRLFKKRF